MKDREKIQKYINNFRRHISNFLKPGIGLVCNVYPGESNGAILEFYLGEKIINDDNYKPIERTINDALAKIDQQAFGGDLSGFTFKGTNIIMEKSNRIILIKGENDINEWNDDSSKRDVTRIIDISMKGKSENR